MKQIILGIWQGAPIWVWPLFFVLLAIGILSMRDRNSSIIPYFFYPLFGLSSFGVINGLSFVPINWITFGTAYVLGAALAFVWQNTLILSKNGKHLSLRGERITLLILMTIYFSNFIGGVLLAVAPTTTTLLPYTLITATLLGLCSGSFTGRAIRVLTLQKRPA